MTRRNVILGATAIVVSVVAIFIGWQLGRDKRTPETPQKVKLPELAIADAEALLVDLYFPGPGGRLAVESRELPLEEDFLAHLRQVLDALLAGPVSADLYAALPPESTVEWLHMNPEGVLYVDLKLGSEETPPAWGSRQEMLAVYSVVNTLLAITPEIRSVILLRNGQQQPTFAGHLDTSRPLVTNQELVATLEP